MANCDTCGFHLDSDDCDMCESPLLHAEQRALRSHDSDGPQRRTSTRSTWWRGIAITPVLLVFFGYFAATNEAVPVWTYTGTLVFFALCVISDSRYVRDWRTGWSPRPTLWTGLVLLNILLGGILTLFITPYYLYKRWQTEPDIKGN